MGKLTRKPAGKRSAAAIAFGIALREVREKKRLTAQALAELSDVEAHFITQIERGSRQPTLTIIFKLAAGLGVEPSQLLVRMERKLQ